jgi:hypothetical protein
MYSYDGPLVTTNDDIPKFDKKDKKDKNVKTSNILIPTSWQLTKTVTFI